ncbi:serine protease [Nocardioides marinisabuli]|uniref:Serine protease n=1 Tax=Nocardioides marinisabuli TaxID=419476 RepID=A0A7Y9EZX5_9ACTN|nr:S8 family serine peptidase [Nocardioides marinisabuli]NYD56821.1 serine protease [Nocardioides marinisabuli]
MRLSRKAGTAGSLFAAAAMVASTTTPAHAATDDPLRGQQWGLDQVRAEAAWPTTTGAGAVVAVVDTGVDFSHPDLRANLLQGATFTGCEGTAPCGNGDFRGPDGENNADEHGTHVAGIVAAVTGNGVGVAGTAPDAKILPVKVLEDGSGFFAEIAAGIRWSADNGADVVNLSLGGLPGLQALTLTGVESDVTDAIAYANERGVTVVAAAGNTATPLCNTPAFEPGAICVASTDRNEVKSWFSELPNKLDLKAVTAPGGAGLTSCEDDIVSTVPLGTGSAACGESDYDYYAGTSMATPHVAGVAALLAAQGRTRENIEAALLDTARQPLTDVTGLYSPVYGWGIVDAAAAVQQPGAATTTVDPAPTQGNGKGKGKGRTKG